MDGNPQCHAEVAVDTVLAQATRARPLHSRGGRARQLALAEHAPRRRERRARRLVRRRLPGDAAPAEKLQAKTEHESPYRLKTSFMAERLRATRQALVDVREYGGEPRFTGHAYRAPEELVRDLRLIDDSLQKNRGARAGDALACAALIHQAQTFGFHLARLDLRIPAEWVRADARVALGLPEAPPHARVLA